MRRSYLAASLVLAAIGAGASAPAALAQGNFSCRASALRVTSPLGNLEPIVANNAGDPCRTEGKSLVALPVPGLLAVGVLNARTNSQTRGATANASVAELLVTLGGNTIQATVLGSRASGTCGIFHPELESSSSILSLTINGKTTVIGGDPITIPVDGIVTVYVNRQIRTQDSVTQRALEVESPLLQTDIVVSETQADVHGTPCQ